MEMGIEKEKEEGSGVNQQQLVVFKLGGEEFGVDIMQVREIIRKIVVEVDKNTVGMAVDAVTEVTYLSESDIDEVPALVKENIGTEYLRGVGKLPNRLLILIDLKRVLHGEEMGDVLHQPA